MKKRSVKLGSEMMMEKKKVGWVGAVHICHKFNHAEESFHYFSYAGT